MAQGKNQRCKMVKLRELSLIMGLTVISFFSASCAPPAIKTTALMPAKYHEASMLREVAVLPFDGPGGSQIAAEIEGTLASININDKQYFTLVDRVKIDKLISEMKLSQIALVDPNTAAKVGKMLGAKGIYTGTVYASDSSDSYYQEKRSKCIRYERKKGRLFGTCVESREYTVNCTKRTATFAFTPKLIDVETGRIVYANNISKSISSSVCTDQGTPASKFELIEKAKDDAKASFINDVAPHYVTFEIKLMDSTDGITSDVAKKKFEQGIDFAKGNRLDRACELWGEARIVSQNAPSILYNLGICSEVTGELEKALDLYKKADRLLDKPDNRITAAIGRVTEAIQKQQKLKEQIAK